MSLLRGDWWRQSQGPTEECVSRQMQAELVSLQRAWFPRSIDRQHGGFLCDFDDRWRPAGPQRKMLEFQARQTLAAARGAIGSTDAPLLREAAVHGFRCLEDIMWDRSNGGWYRMLDRAGTPLEAATKHGHGSSYAISACTACYELTADQACLALAMSAVAWLEEHAHDASHGGYFVFYRRDGTPILTSEALPPGVDVDPIGTPFGHKDVNTTSDLLKAFADLYRVRPDPLVRTRLEELLSVVRDRLAIPAGTMHMCAQPDWVPLPDVVRYGHVLRASNIMLAASAALNGAVDSTTAAVVKSIVERMLSVAWDPRNGGFHAAGGSFAPTDVDGTKVFVRTKSWWSQAEGLKLLLSMALSYPADPADYRSCFLRQWEYIRTYVIDSRHGGWFQEGIDEAPEASNYPKGFTWKDCSHETDVLLDYVRVPSDWVASPAARR